MKVNAVGMRGIVDRFNDAKARKIVNKHVHLNENLPLDVYEKLSSAQSTIANYAKSKGVKVNFEDAKKLVSGEEFDPPRHLEEYLSGKILVSVENLKKQRAQGTLVDADVNKIHTHEKTKFFIKDIPEDGVQVSRKIVNTYEDGFLRHVYRTIENLVKK